MFADNNSITINNITYSKTELSKIADKKLVTFLSEWWDDSEKIKITTSGSTGNAKTIEVHKSQMVASANNTIYFFNLKPNMTALLSLPTTFIAGKMMIVRAIVGGLNLITTPATSTPLSWINREIDFAAFTPMQIFKELKQNSRNLSLLKTVLIGGGHISNELNNMLQSASFKAYETYGMAETLSHIALRKANGLDRQRAFFPVSDTFDFKIGPTGTLLINAPEITNSWITTNDIAKFNKDGSFTIIGRIDNVINSGGIKHSPEEIENKISPIINQPFIISSLPHAELGEQIILIIEGANIDENKLMESIKSKLTRFEQPKAIYFVPKFIYTDSGKIKRKETRAIIND